MITDDDALFLLDRAETEADPAEKSQMLGMLGEYEATKTAAGLKPFQPSPEAVAKKTGNVDRLYAAGIDKLETVLSPEEHEALNAATRSSTNPGEAKARVINSSVVAEAFPNVPADVLQANWPNYRKAYAKAVLGVDKPEVGEGELFSGIAKHRQGAADQRALVGEILQKTYVDAATGNEDFLGSFGKSMKALENDPRWKAADRDKVRAIARQGFDAARKANEPLRPVIDAGERYYFHAANQTDQSDAAKDEFASLLLTLPRAEQEKALFFASKAVAETTAPKITGKEGRASFVEKSAVALGRGISQMGGDIAGAFEQAQLFAGETDLRARIDSGTTDQQVFKRVGEIDDRRERLRIERRIDEALKGQVDPVAANNAVVNGIYGFTESVPYMATVLIPGVGIPLTAAAMGEQARASMEDAGVAPEAAAVLGTGAGIIEAGIEHVQSAMVFTGRLAGFEKWLTMPVTSKGQLVRKLLQTAGVELVAQNTQEAIQDATPLVAQAYGSMLSDGVPDVKWSEELAPFAQGRVDTFYALLLPTLVGAGAATFKAGAYGRQYLENKKMLTALGMTEPQVQAIIDAPTPEAKEAIFQEEWKRREMNTAAQVGAFEELDAEMRGIALEQAESEKSGAKAMRLEDGSWAVLDSEGETVDVTQDADTALALVREVNQGETQNLDSSVEEMISFFDERAGEGSTIERVKEKRTLSDKVDEGQISEEEAQAAVDVANALNQFSEPLTVKTANIEGENEARYDTKAKLFRDVSKIYDGASPLTVVEEKAEGYLKRQIAEGGATIEEVQAWREQVDGKQTDNSTRALTEWFSQTAKAYMVGNIDHASIPASFKAFLRALHRHLAQVLTLAKKLTAMQADGTLDSDLKQHLARAVGLDEAFVAREEQNKEREAAGGRGESLGDWIKGKLPHPDTAKANGEPFAAELRDVFDGQFKSRQAAGAFFAKKGDPYTGLDRLAEEARAAGFAFERGDELLSAVSDSLQGIESFAEAGVELQGATFSLAPPVESEAFKKWFGESKVVDKDGKPLVVYKAMHPYDWRNETNREPLNTIDRKTEFPAFNKGEPGVKIAGFFGDIKTANAFASGGGGQAIYPVYLSFQNPHVIDAKGERAGNIQFGESGSPFREAIRSGKYDGVIIKNTGDEGTIYVALRPEQIKSAIGNRGTFNPANPNITFALAPPVESEAFKAWFGESKVVDKDGKPLVMYHGTKDDFSAFKARFDDGLIFFSSSPKMASEWAVSRKKAIGTHRNFDKAQVGKVKTAYEEYFTKNYRDDMTPGELEKFWAGVPPNEHGLAYGVDALVYPVYLKAEKIFDPAKEGANIEGLLIRLGMRDVVKSGHHLAGHWVVYESKPVIDWMRERGYDAVKLREDPLDGSEMETLAIFSPEQAKSATANRGTFDPSDPNITHSLGSGEFERVMKERRVTQRIAADELSHGDSFSEVLRAMVSGVEYEVLTDVDAVQQAETQFKEKGMDTMLAQFLSDVDGGKGKVDVVIGEALVRSLDTAGKFKEAQLVANRLAEVGTKAGQTIQAFSMLGLTLDTKAKAMVRVATETAKKVEKIKEGAPAIDAAKEEIEKLVSGRAFKLFKEWADDILGFTGKKRVQRTIARVEELPAVTFALSAEIRGSGLLRTVATMIAESGSDATEAALLEKYGEKVREHIPEIFREAVKGAIRKTNAAPKKRKAERERKEKKNTTTKPNVSARRVAAEMDAIRGRNPRQQGELDAGMQPFSNAKYSEPGWYNTKIDWSLPVEQRNLALTDSVDPQAPTAEDVDALFNEIRANASRSQVQVGMEVIEDHLARRSLATPEQVQDALDEARALGVLVQSQKEFAGFDELEGFRKRLEDEVMAALLKRNVTVPRPVRKAIETVMQSHDLGEKTWLKHFRAAFAQAFDVHQMTQAQTDRLGELAQNIKSTPENSGARMLAVVDMNSFIADHVQPYDWIDTAFSLWYSSALAGLQTTQKNILGNSITLTANTGVQMLFQNPAKWLRSWSQLAPAMQSAMQLAAPEAKAEFLRGEGVKTSEIESGDPIKGRKKVLDTKKLVGPWRLAKYVGRFLSVQDTFFSCTASELKARQIALEMAMDAAESGRITEDQIGPEIERILFSSTDQILGFKERAGKEWGMLSDELQGKQPEGEWINRRVQELRVLERKSELTERASFAGERSTFNYAPEGAIGTLLGKLDSWFKEAARSAEIAATRKGAKGAKFIGQFGKVSFLAFFRVPVNMFNLALNYTPVGFARLLVNGQMGVWVSKGGKITTRPVTADEVADIKHKAILGTAALAALWAYARPTPDDDKDAPWLQIHGHGSGNSAKDLARNGPGWKPWSFEIRTAKGKVFLDYKLTPFAPGLAAVAFLHDKERYDKQGDAPVLGWALAQGVASIMLSQAPMQGLGDLASTASIDQIKSETGIRRVLARSVAGYTTNVVLPLANFWRSIDRAIVLDNKKQVDTVGAAMLAQVPFADNWGKDRLDVLGDSMANRPFDWLAQAQANGTPEARIYELFGAKKIQPSDLYPYRHKMEPEQFYAFTKARGAWMKQTLLANNEALLKQMMALSEEPPKEFPQKQSAVQRVMHRLNLRAVKAAKVAVGYTGKPIEGEEE